MVVAVFVVGVLEALLLTRLVARDLGFEADLALAFAADFLAAFGFAAPGFLLVARDLDAGAARPAFFFAGLALLAFLGVPPDFLDDFGDGFLDAAFFDGAIRMKA